MNRHWSKDYDSVETTGVLVVGAGPAGLVTAIGLARHGAPGPPGRAQGGPFVLPAGHRDQPTDDGDHARMGSGAARPRRRVRGRSAGPGRADTDLPQGETVPLGFPTEEELGPVSPTTYAVAAQDAFEPVLADEARTQGSDIRFGTELVALHQEGEGITAMLRDVTTHRRWAVLQPSMAVMPSPS